MAVDNSKKISRTKSQKSAKKPSSRLLSVKENTKRAAKKNGTMGAAAKNLSDERYQAIVESQLDFVDRYLPGGILTYVNGALARYVGMRPEDLIGKSFLPFLHEEDRDDLVKKLEALTREHPLVTVENRVILPDGSMRWHQWTHHAFFDARGAVLEYQSIGRDITDQRKKRDKFRKSQENLKKAEKIAKLGNWEWNILTNEITWSDEVYRIYGMDPAVDKPSYEIVVRTVAAECRDRFVSAVENAVKHGAAFDGEYRMIGLDGKERFTHTIGEVARDDAGRPVMMFGIVQDISDRKRAEQARQEALTTLQALMDNVQQGILFEGRDRRIRYANQAFCSLFGIPSPDLVIGADCARLAQQSKHAFVDPEGFIATIERRLADRATVLAEELHLADGRIMERDHIPVMMGPERSGTYWIYRDITERVRAEAILKTREKQLAESQRIAHIGSWEHNLKTGAVIWSDELFRLLGLDPQKDPADFNMFFNMIHPEDQPALKKAVEKTLQTGEHFSIDYRFILRDGTTRVLYAQAELKRDDTGAPVILSGTGQDFTERKKAETALRESEKRLRTLIDAIPDAVFFKDADGRHIIDNRANETVLGVPPEMLTGKTAEDFMPPDVAAVCRRNDEDVMKKKETVRCEEHKIDKDGNKQILDTIRVPLYDDDGNAIGLVGIVRDITKSKRAEEALAASEERYRFFVEHGNDAVLVHMFEEDGLPGPFREVNDLACAWTGYSKEEFSHMTPKDLNDPDHQNHIPRVIEDLRTKGSAMFETVWRRKGGGQVPVEVSSRKMQIRDKAYIVSVARNIAERKRAEDRLRESEQFVRNILDTVDEGFIVIDREYRIVTANKEYCSQAGLPCDEVIGKPCYEISHKAIRPCYEEGEDCAVRHVFATGESYAVSHKHKDSDGQVLYIETKAFPVKDESGQVTSVIETTNNITERHLLEEERLKTQKLEAIGTLAGGIAHDFNNLLQGVFGYISMAKMNLDKKEKSLAMLEQAEEALHLSVNLTTQLLTFSKGGKPVKRTLLITPVIENAVKFALSGSRADYRLDIDEALRPVEADEGQINQVIQNIVLNADQSMSAGGVIEITARNVPASGNELPIGLAGRHYVKIAVRDSGVGIPGQDISKIFDPYFTTKVKGSGLGLATSYSIIKNHDGMIDVKSEEGKGSVFSIYLPASEAAYEAPAPAAVPARTRKGRILVMDDEDVVRRVASELIRTLDHDVDLAENGDEALLKYRTARDSGRPYDIVILDLTVRGGMGGAEAVGKLLEIAPALKAIVSSGYSDDSVVSEYRAQGFRAFLKKPYNLSELEAVLDTLLAE